MNRTDRLVAMVMQLQGRRVVRAEELAAHFDVTVRTIYRDIAALGEAGVPVVGEAGVGYSLVKGYHLPPVMFTAGEATALFVGGELVKQFSDGSLVAPMESALVKIRSVLPRERQDDLDRLARGTAVMGGRCRLPEGIDQRVLLPIQEAVITQRVLRVTYRGRAREHDTLREVEPLGVVFYTGAWYLVSWCRLRQDFRQFKLERIRRLETLRERFAARPDFSLREYLAKELKTAETIPARVWFASEAFARVHRESFTGFVEARPARDGYEVDFLTFSLPWLARWVLSFGRDAVALAPAKLCALVSEEAAAVAKGYESPLNGMAPDMTLSRPRVKTTRVSNHPAL